MMSCLRKPDTSQNHRDVDTLKFNEISISKPQHSFQISISRQSNVMSYYTYQFIDIFLPLFWTT